VTDLHCTFAAFLTVAVTVVTLAWLLAGFVLELANDGNEITDQPIRDPYVVRPTPRQLGAA
jgi:hypothetical protein